MRSTIIKESENFERKLTSKLRGIALVILLFHAGMLLLVGAYARWEAALVVIELLLLSLFLLASIYAVLIGLAILLIKMLKKSQA